MNRLSNSPYTPDLRGFIAYLEAEHPEQVVRVSRPVDPKFGVSGILERLERDGRFPLVIFENVKGSKIPLVANMHASFERLLARYRATRPVAPARRRRCLRFPLECRADRVGGTRVRRPMSANRAEADVSQGAPIGPSLTQAV